MGSGEHGRAASPRARVAPATSRNCPRVIQCLAALVELKHSHVPGNYSEERADKSQLGEYTKPLESQTVCVCFLAAVAPVVRICQEISLCISLWWEHVQLGFCSIPFYRLNLKLQSKGSASQETEAVPLSLPMNI